ncbi:hypothetical protein ACQFYA_21210 [Promicromonospora sp. Marseille-Q5078]
MTHTTSTPTPSIRARHTATCYAHAIGCAVENIAEWDAETRAAHSTDPIEHGDDYLADGTVSCYCATGVAEQSAATLAAGYAAIDAERAPIAREHYTDLLPVTEDQTVTVTVRYVGLSINLDLHITHDGARTWTLHTMGVAVGKIVRDPRGFRPTYGTVTRDHSSLNFSVAVGWAAKESLAQVIGLDARHLGLSTAPRG